MATSTQQKLDTVKRALTKALTQVTGDALLAPQQPIEEWDKVMHSLAENREMAVKELMEAEGQNLQWRKDRA